MGAAIKSVESGSSGINQAVLLFFLVDHTPQVIAAKRPTTDTPENKVTAVRFDNPHASIPTSSLDKLW